MYYGLLTLGLGYVRFRAHLSVAIGERFYDSSLCPDVFVVVRTRLGVVSLTYCLLVSNANGVGVLCSFISLIFSFSKCLCYGISFSSSPFPWKESGFFSWLYRPAWRYSVMSRRTGSGLSWIFRSMRRRRLQRSYRSRYKR